MLTLVLATAVFLVLGGYAWGRRAGQAEGLRAGHQRAGLTYYAKALTEGRCPVCGIRSRCEEGRPAGDNIPGR
ncbi:MAG: hypothetical protein AB1331_01595 [Bacillota bacterium]